MLKKIISGGQTGADRGGLEAAKECNIPTGGTAPYKYRTENGPDLSLKDYGLEDCGVSRYTHRTEMNVKNSDGTVIFTRIASSGSLKTLEYCEKYNKPYIMNPLLPVLLSDWLVENNIEVLNVAGNRESKAPGIQAETCIFMINTILTLKENK